MVHILFQKKWKVAGLLDQSLCTSLNLLSLSHSPSHMDARVFLQTTTSAKVQMQITKPMEKYPSIVNHFKV